MPGTNTAAKPEPLATDVEVTEEEIIAHLTDGQGIHWPDTDEDISVRGMLEGTPAPPPSTKPKTSA